MSAIWGVITFDDKKGMSVAVQEGFERVYKESCKLERYEHVCTSQAYIGCGLQYITKESEKEELPIFKNQSLIFP